MRAMRRIRWGMAAFLLVLASLAAGAAPERASVPNVTGQPLADAAARLADAGLAFRVEWTREGREHHVVDQHPRPGTVVGRGDEVLLIVAAPGSEAPRPGVGTAVEIPPLRGTDFAGAQRSLLDLGLLVVPEFVRTGTQPGWTVLGLDPPAGERAEVLSRVTLRVELPFPPPTSVVVPSLFGVNARQGADLLASLDLLPRVERVPSDLPPGNGLVQEPAAGSRVRRGSHVRVLVTERRRPGETTPRVQVPEVAGLALPDAYERLRASGLVWQLRSRPAADALDGRVLAQSPRPGQVVAIGSPVALEVPAIGEVPLLEGRSLGEAARLAEAAGFAVEATGSPAAGARVVHQRPPAGFRAPLGSTIHLRARGGGIVASFTRVPQLVGEPLRQAEHELEVAGLAGSFQGPPRLGHRPAVVTGQFPLAGTTVRTDTVVHVTYDLVHGGGAADRVRVPDVRGLSLEAAERRLADRGLGATVAVVLGFGPSGVVSQRPEAGASVRPGTVVRLTYRR